LARRRGAKKRIRPAETSFGRVRSETFMTARGSAAVKTMWSSLWSVATVLRRVERLVSRVDWSPRLQAWPVMRDLAEG